MPREGRGTADNYRHYGSAPSSPILNRSREEQSGFTLKEMGQVAKMASSAGCGAGRPQKVQNTRAYESLATESPQIVTLRADTVWYVRT